jgi:hypothetical protein
VFEFGVQRVTRVGKRSLEFAQSVGGSLSPEVPLPLRRTRDPFAEQTEGDAERNIQRGHQDG